MDTLSIYSILARYAGVQASPHDVGEALLKPIPASSLLARAHLHDALFGVQAEGSPNLIISGTPGCGKTRLALALAVCRALQRPDRTVFYAAPTRPLAQETFNNLQRLGAGLLRPGDIVLSTGDITRDDWKIYKGNVRICVTIFEKLLSMLLTDWALREKGSLFIVDEAHMFNEPERGVKLDMLLSALRVAAGKDETDSPAIVLLTVESGNSLKTLGSRLVRHQTGEPVPPLCISGNQRVYPQNHYWVAHGHVSTGEKQLGGEAQPIGRLRTWLAGYPFTPADGLYLDKEKLHAIPQKIEDLARLSSEGDKAFFLDQELILKLARRYPRLMVVGLSLSQLESAAYRLMQQRGKRTEDVKFCNGLEELKKSGVVSENYAEELRRLAQAGIFLHTGAMHMDLRKLVEERFQDQDAAPGILLATTTMAYGVNLVLDAVALTTLSFPGPKGTRRMMDSVVYHNIMGRAGRFSPRGGDCLLLLPATLKDEEQTSAAWEMRRAAIQACYAPHELPALDPNPLDARLSADDPNRQTMLMLALHMAELDVGDPVDGVPTRAIARMLQDSVHAQILGLSLDAIEASVFRGLEELAKVAVADCRLLEKSGDATNCLWKSTPSGRALLDCGGVVEDALRMGAFLEHGIRHFSQSFRATPLFPLAAAVLNPRIRKVIDSMFGPVKPPQAGRSAVNPNVRGAVAQLARVFGSSCAIGAADAREMVETLAQALSSFMGDSGEEGPHDLRRALIILAAVLQWIDGKDLGTLENTLGGNTGGRPVRFQPRLAEQFSWCCRELAGFFGGTRLMGAAGMAETARLARRLQNGLRDEWLPFLGAGHNRGSVVGFSLSSHTPEELSSRKQRVAEYYLLEAKSYLSWLSRISDEHCVMVAEEVLLPLLTRKADAREMVSAALLEIFPAYDWQAECAMAVSVDWLARGWAYLTVAALMRQNIVTPADFPDGIPLFLEEIFVLLDRKRVPRNIFGQLAFINAPRNPQRK